ncbi:MAG: glycosyltransferase family 2 protein [Gemmatimonadota bacterium]|nr:glycosyltransferase family 2 protein [Gemmatimonadota bacterium]
MRVRSLILLVAGAAVAGLALGLVFAADFAGVDTRDLALQIGVAFVLTFLIILILRYVILLWLGYLHHVETDALPEELAEAPPVTVLVPAHNEEAVIESALRSLLALDYPAYEVIVVDDGSTDGTAERVAALAGDFGRARIRVVSQPNRGKASALNAGIALARSDYILCMDADSRLSRDALRMAMRHFRDPRVGAVAGNVKVVNRDTMWTALQALEYIEGLNLARRAQGFLRVVNIVPGPIGVFRREVLAGVGGYDTDTFAEDADLTLKILTAGWHVTYEDRAIAWTEAPERLHDLIKQRYRWTRGILQALRKRSAWLGSPRRGRAVWTSLQAMLFEAVIWPVVNVVGNLFFALTALAVGATSGVVVYWWLLLTLLDVAAALHTIGMEEEDLGLVPYAILYRFLFITMVDVAKLFAAVEEFANVRMTWGKLERAGRI